MAISREGQGGIWTDISATGVPLHIRFAAIARHVLTALTLSLGHLVAWQKTDKLRNQDPED